MSVATLLVLGQCSGPQTPAQLVAALWGPGSGYDKDTRPTVAMAARRGDLTPQPAETVFVMLQPFAIQSVDQSQGAFTVELWERVIWWDHRLQYDTTCFKPRADSGFYERYGYHESFAPENLNLLWQPGLVTSNLRTS